MQFPATNRGPPSPPAWPVRPYGEALDDLAIDPLEGALPIAAARVLSACVGDIGRVHVDVLAWPVNLRLQGLLAVTIASFGPEWIWSTRCTAPGCEAAMDLSLALQDFLAADVAERVECKLADGRNLSVAVPTGRDQLDWLGEVAPGEDDMLRRLLPQGAVEEGLDLADRAAIEQALVTADPLRTLEIETACPECGSDLTLPFDLEAACLARLAGLRPLLLDEVHMLASAYHWSESEIMAVPAARRAAYLARIEGLRA